ncbi:membrane fusion protein, macrolide-specific efflux system [Desulfotomaculum arcticum]|uniref:Membrane fusion protein, macrolide-specific efflux system n=1 Tax=Desulfotruncus arcticus DSM 17038 TaxID=1121424 RepID=A0A1I2MU76_9FIRM|nr:efflux RND transporter periplasmic adaptor subunit [Desulfotruncus arcticus]SFF93037.1 membrane fusion protein, macrolide-specific efflux system [Desulfotomaculum arcticum] [Desulfotruncus arcticus DSM 17038]
MIKLKNKKAIWFMVISVIVIAAGTSYWLKNKNQAENTEVQYEQAQVTRNDIVVGFDSDGTIDYSKVNLRFGVKGTISEIQVAEGDKVNKGDIIAKLNDKDYQDQYQLALARLQDAQEEQQTSLLNDELSIKKTESDLQLLKDEYQEMEAIPDAYSANDIKMKKMELDNKETEYQNMLKQYELNKNKELQQDELQVKMAQEDLEDTILYAPVSGVVLGLSAKVGESLTDEEDFAIVHESNVVKAVTNVIEYDISQIKVGQKVYVTAEALPDQKFAGEVSKINSLPSEDSSGLVNYSVEVTIKDPSPELKDGMTCSVSFILKEVNNCLIVPYKSIRMVDGKQVVTVIDRSGQQVDKQIKAGFTDGNEVEVLDGLNVGETVVYQK